MVALEGGRGQTRYACETVGRDALSVATREGGLLRCESREASTGDGRLAVGNAAVVDGHGMGNQDSKTGVFEFAREELKQKSVHEHAARERDGVDAFSSADFACDLGRCARNDDMEVERELVGRRAGLNSLQKRLKKWSLVQNEGAIRGRLDS